MNALEFGNYRIGVMDASGGNIRPLAGFATGSNTNPEFSSDGEFLYFVAAPDGIPNIYRADRRGGNVTQVTNVLSGIAGITPLTPALSVASNSPALVFTVFEADKYNLYVTEGASRLAGRAPQDIGRNAAVLPPPQRTESVVTTLLQQPTIGLPNKTTYEEQEYRPRLSLDMVGQPTFGIGADRFGAYGAGGLSLLWSDMLGNHTLGTTVQVTNRVQEIGGAVFYLNQKNRWNWGFIGEQTPYVTGAFAQGITTIDGVPRFVEQTFRITQINSAASAIAQYPFSRAQRLEFAAGVRRIGFDQELETRIFTTAGDFIDQQTQDLPRPNALGLGEASAALVYDTSLFGATGPILGQRYRFEYTQMAGSLLYSGVLADFRRYFLPARPFTVAVRGLHYGRYGRDGEDERLSPLFLGYPGLVRGYEVNSFDANECVPNATSDCPAFDRLVGSRMAVASAELRFPLLGLFSRGRSYYGAFPVEMALFGDAGMAWTADQRPRFIGGTNSDRDWVKSAGVALRVNALGFAVLEFDYVRPFDRPNEGWVWQFNLTPGW